MCVNNSIELVFVVPGVAGSVQSVEIGHRLQGTTTYTTTQGQYQGGATQTVIINVNCVGTCDGVVYEGYIKNLCVDQPEIPWTALVVDTSVTDCYQFQWTCSSVGIDSVTPDNNGTNYVVGDTLVFTGGGGTGAQGTVATVNGSGTPTSFTITNAGSGYTSAPTVSVNSTAGIGAAPTAVLADCPNIDHGYCTGSTTQVMSLPLGESFIECSSRAQFDIKVNNLTSAQEESFTYLNIGTNCTCAPCQQLNVLNNDATNPVTIVYNKCTNGELHVEEIAPGIEYNAGCTVLCDTVEVITPNANVTITCGTC